MRVFLYFLICGLIFLICLHMGLSAKVEKRVSKWLVLERIFISLLLIGKIVQMLRNINNSWGINLVQVLILIVVMILSEMGFRRKRLTFGDPYLNRVIEVISLAAIVVILI